MKKVSSSEALELPELMELVSKRLKEAIKATRKAHKAVASTLESLSDGPRLNGKLEGAKR